VFEFISVLCCVICIITHTDTHSVVFNADCCSFTKQYNVERKYFPALAQIGLERTIGLVMSGEPRLFAVTEYKDAEYLSLSLLNQAAKVE